MDKINDMNPVHINLIRNLYREMKLTERLPEQTSYTQRKYKELRHDLMLARKYQAPVKPMRGKTREYTVYYGEYDIFDNMEVVGKDYIWQMYRNVPSLIWRTAFMNERLFRVANGFYSALNDYHFYTPRRYSLHG